MGVVSRSLSGSVGFGDLLLMTMFTPSDAAVDALLKGGRLTSGKIIVGPLGPEAVRLLRVLWRLREDLARRKGAEQVAYIRHAYINTLDGNQLSLGAGPDAIKAPSAALASTDHPAGCVAAAGSTGPKWRLHHLRCQSIRGVAPCGETFEFTFDGTSHLIYGPNGSGKSSLLNAVIWVLSGSIVTDCDEDPDEIPLYAPPKTGGRSPKLRDWPAVHTLPDDADPRTAELDCWAEISLTSADGTISLHLRRALPGNLEESRDGADWVPCDSLERHGITALDLQLSVSAATVFGRRSIEASEDTRRLLSMLLGYDFLEELGGSLTTFATNLTKALKAERDAVESRRNRLLATFSAMPARLRVGLPLREAVAVLAGGGPPCAERIEEIRGIASANLLQVELEVASLLGIRSDTDPPSPGLADALTAAVATLRRPWGELFATLASLRPGFSVAEAERSLLNFERSVAGRIRERFAWWREESEPGSKASILIQAVPHYDPADPRCPVCEQSIEGLDIEAGLRRLRNLPADLRSSPREFFRNLIEELSQALPPALTSLAEKTPDRRLQEDWRRLKGILGDALAPIVARFDPEVAAIVEAMGRIAIPDGGVMPPESETGTFGDAAVTFLTGLRSVRKGLALARWAEEMLPAVANRLRSIMTADDEDGTLSLAAVLAKGRHAAADGGPIAALCEDLALAAVEAGAIRQAERDASALSEIQTALEAVKPIGKYAEAEVGQIFDAIRDKTIENYRKLYPHSSPNLVPSRLHINKGRDKSVEAYLKGKGFEVPGQAVANAGLLRAVALAFYFALLERHPGGLGFILMDDPILSLDDDHREAWSSNILGPALASIQVIVATHQKQFLNNCRSDFRPGRLVELNPRARNRRITHRPGDRLERAEQMMVTAWSSGPNEMRKYREELLITLDSYSPTAFFNAKGLRHSLEQYDAFVHPNPMASTNQKKITGRLFGEKICRVLDPGSHAPTEADVTEPMVREALSELRELDKTFRHEVERLEIQRLREQRGRFVTSIATDHFSTTTTVAVALTSAGDPGVAVLPLDRLRVGDEEASWSDPISLQVVGAAAALSRGCVVDLAEETRDVEFPAGGAILVTGESLLPVARPGQWALLAAEDTEVDDGDLVAVIDRSANHYLRRIWSCPDTWMLEAVNPLAGVAPVVLRKRECVVRKIIGVSYDPRKDPFAGKGPRTKEWLPRKDFSARCFDDLLGISIDGTSLEPIACHGQIVLVGPRVGDRVRELRSGSLAVVETKDESVGNVIKRIFPQDRGWVLASPNPIDPREPITVSPKMIRAVWPVRGILFACS